MIVVLKPAPTAEMIQRVVLRVEGLGLKAHVIVGTERTVVAAVGNERNGAQQELESCDEVEKVLPILAPYKIASRETRTEPTVVKTGPLSLGGGHIGVIAGPCSVEDEAQILLAAEYILDQGNTQVILCERGIRTFESHTRFTLPLATVPYLKERTHLPVVVDPSHGTGIASLVPAMSAASVAAGCDGLIIEVHPDPSHAMSDGAQTLTPAAFEATIATCRLVANALGKTM